MKGSLLALKLFGVLNARIRLLAVGTGAHFADAGDGNRKAPIDVQMRIEAAHAALGFLNSVNKSCARPAN